MEAEAEFRARLVADCTVMSAVSVWTALAHSLCRVDACSMPSSPASSSLQGSVWVSRALPRGTGLLAWLRRSTELGVSRSKPSSASQLPLGPVTPLWGPGLPPWRLGRGGPGTHAHSALPVSYRGLPEPRPCPPVSGDVAAPMWGAEGTEDILGRKPTRRSPQRPRSRLPAVHQPAPSAASAGEA